MNWSAEQQRLLGAMGFQLMVRVAPGEMPGSAKAAISAPSALDRTANPGAVRGKPGSASAQVSAAELFPELTRSIRRAAGDREIDGLVEDLERLRREPALKRALWPKLKALRRSH
jgi:hypothetical protein